MNAAGLSDSHWALSWGAGWGAGSAALALVAPWDQALV